MFGTDAAFNPDLLSGRLEEILPTIQQVIVTILTAVGLLGVRLLVDHVYSTHRYYHRSFCLPTRRIPTFLTYRQDTVPVSLPSPQQI
jgi:hypothetical protein